MPVEAYVLQKFSAAEREEIEIVYQEAQEAIKAILAEGIEYAMNNFNKKG
jgi:peptidyl-tRNA hydrolase